MNTKIPVIIAARNEERFIGQTLDALDASTTEPWIIVNDSSDRTADIARDYGAIVHELPTPGKLPAIQYALKRLNHQALEPLLLTDADSYPVFPRLWASGMLRALGAELQVVGGLCVARGDEAVLHKTLTSMLRVANVMDKLLRSEDHISGANTMVRIHDAETLEKVLALGNIWPQQDRALANEIAGPEPKKISLHPETLVATSSRYLVSPLTMARRGKVWSRQAAYGSRVVRAAVPMQRHDSLPDYLTSI